MAVLRLSCLVLAFNGIGTEGHLYRSGETLEVQSTLAVESSLKGEVAPWAGTTPQDLHKEYYQIFQSGNRNAASHLWSKFLLDRADQMDHDKLSLMFSGFCAVSGSPVSPQYRTRYLMDLGKVGGGTKRGYMYYCCWPCVCDTQDFIKVDTKTITLLNGVTRQYHFTVLGNPCIHPEKLNETYRDTFDGSQTTVLQQAPELKCNNGELEGAYKSDGGHIIINMFFDEDSSLQSLDETQFANECSQRAAAGYNSGMGEIFRKVAGINPIQV